MADLNLKDLLPKVKAPEDFEERVLEKIRERKKARKKYFLIALRIIQRPSIMLASALMVLLILGIIFWPQIYNSQEKPEKIASSRADRFGRVEPSILSLIEPVDFLRDFADSPAKRVIYILETVNENFIPGVKY